MQYDQSDNLHYKIVEQYRDGMIKIYDANMDMYYRLPANKLIEFNDILSGFLQQDREIIYKLAMNDH